MTQTIEQLQAKIAELEEALLKTKMDLLTSYGESEELLGRIAELEADVERLSAAHVKACQANADSQAELAKAEQRVAKYNELIYAVQTKNPDETRHQTALRYIRNAENRPSNATANGASS